MNREQAELAVELKKMRTELNRMASFYGQVDIPEVESFGFTLQARAGDILEPKQEVDHENFTQVDLRPEVREWCDINLTDKFWFSGGPNTFGFSPDEYDVSFTFCNERDYILFKMRWT